MQTLEKEPGQASQNVWVQYSLFFRGEPKKIGEAILKLEEGWLDVPRQVLSNWLKQILIDEMSYTLSKVDAIQVSLEMPYGKVAGNDDVFDALSNGLANVVVVSPYPSVQAALTLPAASPLSQESALDSQVFGGRWNAACNMASLPFSNIPGASPDSFPPQTVFKPCQTGCATQQQSTGYEDTKSREKRKRQNVWTDEQTLVLIDARKMESEERSGLLKGAVSSDARWDRVAQLVHAKGILDREGKNCEDKINNVRRDWSKVKEWNSSNAQEYWSLSAMDRRANKLPPKLSKSVFFAIEEADKARLDRRQVADAASDRIYSDDAETGASS